MNYCIIDESDPNDLFECEGIVCKSFFESSTGFNPKQSKNLIRKNLNIEGELKKGNNNYYNIFHLSAHGFYRKNTVNRLDYSVIYQKKGRITKEIFRSDSIVRTGLQADVFVSTNCETFNPAFLDVIRHYGGVSNFIAPVNKPFIGNTLIFSLMFYNKLLRKTSNKTLEIPDKVIIEAFLQTGKSHESEQ